MSRKQFAMSITTLFFDVGGVLLTNGWDHESRERAAKHFDYDYDTSEARHQEVAEPFECGQLNLDDYLKKVVFFQDRSFSQQEFVRFMEQQSQPYEASLEVLRQLAAQNNYQLATVNNESTYVNLYRIRTFHLTDYFSAFFSSCFLGVTKPACEIFQKALYITQRRGEECLFVDDREENAAAAQQCGIQGVHLPQPSDLVDVLRAKGVSF